VRERGVEGCVWVGVEVWSRLAVGRLRWLLVRLRCLLVPPALNRLPVPGVLLCVAGRCSVLQCVAALNRLPVLAALKRLPESIGLNRLGPVLACTGVCRVSESLMFPTVWYRTCLLTPYTPLWQVCVHCMNFLAPYKHCMYFLTLQTMYVSSHTLHT